MDRITEQEVIRLPIGRCIFVLHKRSDGTYRSEPIPMPEQPDFLRFARKLVAVVRSESTPTLNYYLYRESDGDISCTCYGYRSPNKCWHVRRLKERVEQGLDLELLKEPIRDLTKED